MGSGGSSLPGTSRPPSGRRPRRPARISFPFRAFRPGRGLPRCTRPDRTCQARKAGEDPLLALRLSSARPRRISARCEGVRHAAGSANKVTRAARAGCVPHTPARGSWRSLSQRWGPPAPSDNRAAAEARFYLNSAAAHQARRRCCGNQSLRPARWQANRPCLERSAGARGTSVESLRRPSVTCPPWNRRSAERKHFDRVADRVCHLGHVLRMGAVRFSRHDHAMVSHSAA